MAYFVLGQRITGRPHRTCAVASQASPCWSIRLPRILQEPIGLLLAFCCALRWGAGTVYMKWARVKGDLLGSHSGRLSSAVVAIGIAYLVFNVCRTTSRAMADWAACCFWRARHRHSPYFIWFNIIGGCRP